MHFVCVAAYTFEMRLDVCVLPLPNHPANSSTSVSFLGIPRGILREAGESLRDFLDCDVLAVQAGSQLRGELVHVNAAGQVGAALSALVARETHQAQDQKHASQKQYHNQFARLGNKSPSRTATGCCSLCCRARACKVF